MKRIIRFMPISKIIRSTICIDTKKLRAKQESIEINELKKEIEKGKKELDLAIEQDKEYSYIYKQSVKLDETINEYMRIVYNIKKTKLL